MAARAITTTKEYLIKAELPQSTASYTVIEHEFVIKKALGELASKGFEIKDELYRCNIGAKVAQGVYHLNYGSDPEMGMMFAWSNSYDKSMRFKCAIGGYVFVCMNGVVSGNMGSWGRVHTGKADQDTTNAITNQIDAADIYYNQLVSDKQNMQTIILDTKRKAEIMGRLFFEHKLLNLEQLSLVKQEMHKPSFDYNSDTNSLWVLYNHITHALKGAHPVKWMDQQRMIHWFLTEEFGITNALIANVNTPVIPVISNQLDLIDAIRDAEQS